MSHLSWGILKPETGAKSDVVVEIEFVVAEFVFIISSEGRIHLF